MNITWVTRNENRAPLEGWTRRVWKGKDLVSNPNLSKISAPVVRLKGDHEDDDDVLRAESILNPTPTKLLTRTPCTYLEHYE